MSQIKIIDIETMVLTHSFGSPVTSGTRKLFRRDVILIWVHTDEGITGVAFLTGLGLAHGSETLVIDTIILKGLKKILIGKDPVNTERLWSEMYKGTLRFGRRGAVIRAISGVDLALWDVRGKAADMPIYKMLGGFRDTVPAYASGIYYGPVKETVEQAKQCIKQGFKALKMHIGRLSIRKDLERVKAVRNSVGEDIDIMLDAMGSYSVKTSRVIVKKLENYNVFWLEEPLPLDDVSGYARLTPAVDIPIAAGGSLYTRYEFLEFIRNGALDIIQPDVTRVGGLTEWIKVAALASAWNIQCAPHAVQEFHTHLVAGVSNGLMVEFFEEKHPLQQLISDLLENPIKPHDGYIEAPKEPGFGLKLKDEAIEKYRVRST